MTEQVLLALSTFPDAEIARKISNQLVSEKFVACANIIPSVESIYRWNEEVETGNETLVFFKLSEDRYQAFQEKLLSLHPYEVPETICLKIDKGSPAYLRWVLESCR
jgi:periplasmic divalent cation tolerance protein